MTAYFVWNIDPTIFTIGGFQLRWYGILFALSFYLGFIVISRIYKREGIAIKLLDRSVLYMGIGTISGARLGHCLLYGPYFDIIENGEVVSEGFLSHPINILKIWEGGLASHGAAIGILVGLALFCIVYKVNYLWILDRMTIGIALSGFLIRLGNFFNSEILGNQTEVPWAVVFPAVDSTPRHPAQLYEAFFYLFVFGAMMWLYWKRNVGNTKGILFSVFVILVFGFRIFVEQFKENQVPLEEGFILNFGQYYSIPFLLSGLALLFVVVVRKKRFRA